MIPPDPLPPLRGMKALGKWLNQLLAYVRSLAPMPSHNVRVVHTAIGTSYVAVPQATAAPSAGMHFEGEWVNSAYTVGAVVVIRAGISAGTYVAVQAVPAGTPAPTDPATGTYWVSLARGNILGTYF